MMHLKLTVAVGAVSLLVLAADAGSDAQRNDSTEMNAVKDVSSASCVKDGVRVLFLGNSITLHGAAPQIGWTNEWGMAASRPENDFVHIVTCGIEAETGRKANVRVRNVADFERNFATWQPDAAIRELVDFDAQYVVFAIGENTPDLAKEEERAAYRDALKRFFSLFLHGRAKPHAVVRGVFWPNDWKDACLAHAASDLAFAFVKADFGNLRGMDACGRYWHSGVARHPGDAGMAAIAAAVLDGFFPKDSGYAAWVDDKPVEVRPIRVSRQPFNQWAPGYQRPADQTEVAGLLRFETEGACRLRVRQTPFRDAAHPVHGTVRPTTNVVVRPLSAGVKPAVDKDGVISFVLPRPGYYVLEIDGLHRPLEIFAQPKRDFAAERREANVVFGPGLHEPVVVKLKSHDRVYIDRDAVVCGSFQADGVEDVKVFGYGIICGERNRRVKDNCYREGMDGAVRIVDSRNVTFDGPTVLDSCCWCVSAFHSSDLELRNLKVTGAWRYNTDGIDICNCQRVAVADCYVHSFDDALVVKGISHYYPEGSLPSVRFQRSETVEDVRFSGCVCWCGWGRTLEIGLETWAKRFRGIVFEDCDLIHNNGAALSVHLGGPAVVEDASYRNIRIECDGSDECSILQTNRVQRATCPRGRRIGWLSVTNGKMFGKDSLYGGACDFSKEPNGTVRKLTVDDVSIRLTNGAPRPWLGAQAEGTPFGELSLSDVTLDGAPLELTAEEREAVRKSFSEVRGDNQGVCVTTEKDGRDRCVAKATVEGEPPSLLPCGREFELVWHDEFGGNALDASKWSYRTNFWGQRFAALATPEDKAVEVKDGKAFLKLVRKPDGQFVSPQLQTGELMWDIPWVADRTSFWPLPKREPPKFVHKFGYYECRCRLQKMPGWWSAFWMQSETQGTCLDPERAGVEHDIMESFEPGTVIPHCFHANGYGPDHCQFMASDVWKKGMDPFKSTVGVDPDEFHVFGMLWEPDGYTCYIDGRQDGTKVGYATGDPVSHCPEFILISTEAKWYRWGKMTGKGVPELGAAAAAGDAFVVDYVRVYDLRK